MKPPYFTKWIPDKKGTHVSLDNPKQKLTLFLCSRDIKVGDKYRHFEEVCIAMGWEDEEEIADDKAIKHNKQYSNMYKVIGKVSPRAVWVKEEGMEFEESDVRIEGSRDYSVTKNYPGAKLTVPGESCDPRPHPYVRIIEFKCPICETFH